MNASFAIQYCRVEAIAIDTIFNCENNIVVMKYEKYISGASAAVQLTIKAIFHLFLCYAIWNMDYEK